MRGSDPKLRDEGVLFSAHHDHLGVGKPDASGDRIYNGAIDNASGCAILLDLARVWSQTKPAPKKRSLPQAATTLRLRSRASLPKPRRPLAKTM